MSNEDYIRGLFDGAKMGAGQIPVALRFFDEGFVGTSSQLATLMNEHPNTVAARVMILHDKGFIFICDWNQTKAGPRAIYAWGPGEADVPRPLNQKELVIQRAVESEMKRKQEREATLADVQKRATGHGTEEVKGAVRVHRMRG